MVRGQELAKAVGRRCFEARLPTEAQLERAVKGYFKPHCDKPMEDVVDAVNDLSMA